MVWIELGSFRVWEEHHLPRRFFFANEANEKSSFVWHRSLSHTHTQHLCIKYYRFTVYSCGLSSALTHSDELDDSYIEYEHTHTHKAMSVINMASQRTLAQVLINLAGVNNKSRSNEIIKTGQQAQWESALLLLRNPVGEKERQTHWQQQMQGHVKDTGTPPTALFLVSQNSYTHIHTHTHTQRPLHFHTPNPYHFSLIIQACGFRQSTFVEATAQLNAWDRHVSLVYSFAEVMFVCICVCGRETEKERDNCCVCTKILKATLNKLASSLISVFVFPANVKGLQTLHPLEQNAFGKTN